MILNHAIVHQGLSYLGWEENLFVAKISVRPIIPKEDFSVFELDLSITERKNASENVFPGWLGGLCACIQAKIYYIARKLPLIAPINNSRK